MRFRSPTDQPVHMALTSGHTCVVGPEPTDVPPMFRRQAVAEGCIPEGMDEAGPTPERTEKTKRELILQHIREMVSEGREDDFNNDGKPDTRKLSGRVGFQVSRDERDEAWQALAD